MKLLFLTIGMLFLNTFCKAQQAMEVARFPFETENGSIILRVKLNSPQSQQNLSLSL